MCVCVNVCVCFRGFVFESFGMHMYDMYEMHMYSIKMLYFDIYMTCVV